jgi:hypothetical protein
MSTLSIVLGLRSAGFSRSRLNFEGTSLVLEEAGGFVGDGPDLDEVGP